MFACVMLFHVLKTVVTSATTQHRKHERKHLRFGSLRTLHHGYHGASKYVELVSWSVLKFGKVIISFPAMTALPVMLCI